MTYEKMKAVLQDYNWDNGFDVPKQILLDENCDLALALEVFYLGDGFGYFQTFAHNIGGTKEWFALSVTCTRILITGNTRSQSITIQFRCHRYNVISLEKTTSRKYF